MSIETQTAICHSVDETNDKVTKGKKVLHTNETGRVIFPRRAKQLPLATNKTVLGHVA